MSVKGKNPKEVLREKTRNLPRQFPEGVCFNRSAAGGISAWLPFNGVHYEAFGDYSKHAVQKLAVYILYGEFGQDAVELYNYYLQSDAKGTEIDTSLSLDSDTVRREVEKMKQGKEESKPKSKRGKKEEATKNEAGASQKPKKAAMQQNTLVTNIDAHAEMTTTKIGSKSKKRKSEKLANDAVAQQEFLEDDRTMDCEDTAPIGSEVPSSDFQPITERDVILELERKLSKQMLITFEPVKLPSEDEMENKIKRLEDFINHTNYDIEIESCAFECVPKGCSPFYCLIGLEYLDKTKRRSNDHVFVGKGWEEEHAKCYALQVTVHFIKRSRVLGHKLIPPNDDVMLTLAHVLESEVSEIPFKAKLNKQFALYQVSLAHKDKSYLSGYYAEESDAREDVARKLLRSMDYCFCGDSKNRSLAIDENVD